MKMKRIMTCLLALLIMVTSFTPAFAEDEKTDDFEGKRSYTLSIDSSDLENFFEGGRSAFELAIRSEKPEWLDCSIKTIGRDVNISFEFSFDDFADYRTKLSLLVTYEPALIYDMDSGLMLAEGFSAATLVNFIYFSLKTMNGFDEFSYDELFTVVSNDITINGKEYNQGDRVWIVPERFNPVKMDELRVVTSVVENSEYERQITSVIKKENATAEDIEKLHTRFERVGEVTDESDSDKICFTVSFTACNQNELITKSIQCIWTTVDVAETQVYIDEETVGVTRSEQIAWDELKVDENSTLRYTFNAPEYYKNIESKDENIYVSENRIETQNGNILWYYERPFAFSEVKIVTDFSSIWPEVKREIVFSAPSYIAGFYHEKIKEKLSGRLEKGMTLDIYDSAGIRHYTVSFSSCFIKDIAESTKSAMGPQYKIDKKESLLPAVKNSYSESGSVKPFLNDHILATNTILVYKFSDAAQVYAKSNSGFTKSSDQEIYKNLSQGRFSVEFEFRRLSMIKIILIVILLIIVIVATLVIRKLIKVQKAKKDGTYTPPDKSAKNRKQKPLRMKRKAITAADGQSQQQKAPPQQKMPPQNNVPPQRKVPPKNAVPPQRSVNRPVPPVNRNDGIKRSVQSQPTRPATQQKSAQFCRKCGERLVPGVKFCRKCGTKTAN